MTGKGLKVGAAQAAPIFFDRAARAGLPRLKAVVADLLQRLAGA